MKTKMTFNALYLVGALVFAMVFTSCNSYQKSLNRGDNDQAFDKAVRKLERNAKSEKAALALEKAYNRLESKDLRAIKFAKAEGDPAKNVEILELYTSLSRRQLKVESLLPLFMKKENRFVDIELVNYDAEYIASKKTAALYLYTKGSKLLESGNRADAREAHYLFNKVISFYPTFRDVRRMAQISKSAGKSNVLLDVRNASGQHVPEFLYEDIKRIGMQHLDWANVHHSAKGAERIDYIVNFTVEELFVSPEAIREQAYRAEKEILTEQVLTINNKVQLDSLGKPIIIDVASIIYCNVVEVNQVKEGFLRGRIEVIENASKQLLLDRPVQGNTVFENRYGMANGNLDALNSNEKRLLENRPVPFPKDRTILERSAEEIKPMLVSIIQDYKHLFI